MSKQPKTVKDSSCYIGGPLTGKTQRLVDRVERLVEQGDASILVFCASDWLASCFSQRLENALKEKAGGVHVTTPRAYAEKLVREPAARQLTGRRGRVMEPYEEKLFFEDMRTITMKGRRLHEMLGFLYRELSELKDEDDWDATYEEDQVMRFAREILSFTGGILESELPGFAVKALESDANLREKYSSGHVIVDDYTALSRGLQVFCTELATESIAIAGDETDCGPTCDDYPYPAGISEFLRSNPGAQVTELGDEGRPEGILKAIAPIRAGLKDGERSKRDARAEQEDRTELHPESFESEGVSVKFGEDMGDELRAIAETVRDARSGGKTVLICGTDRVWRANVKRALESVGYPCHGPQPPIRVRDFGDERAIRRALADTHAKLVADPHDSVAWRSIAGLGDYVGRSDALQQLRELTQDEDLGIKRALDALSREKIEGIDAQGRTMPDLVAIYQETEKALSEGLWDDEASKLRANVPAAWQTSSIMIADPRECFGVQADVVVFGGFVNGLIPVRDYFDESKLIGNKLAHERTRCLQMIYLVAGRAREKLVFTAFQLASLEVAERMGLHSVRIRLKKGIRTSTISPSIFLHTMGLA